MRGVEGFFAKIPLKSRPGEVGMLRKDSILFQIRRGRCLSDTGMDLSMEGPGPMEMGEMGGYIVSSRQYLGQRIRCDQVSALLYVCQGS